MAAAALACPHCWCCCMFITVMMYLLLHRAPEGVRFRPYDLLVVQRQKIGPEYFTVSATGVMRIKRGVQVGRKGVGS